MPNPPSARPRKGLTPDEALARWSDPDLYKELIAIAETSDFPTLQVSSHYIHDAARLKSYRDKREALEDALIQRLCSADIFSSAIAKGAYRREVIHQTLWETLWIDHDFDHIVGDGRFFDKPEFFGADAIPLNVEPIPDWVRALIGPGDQNEFWHDSEYKNITLNGVSYSLSDLHARIVKLLHQASLNGNPWQRGKTLLGQAESTQIKMSDVFKSRTDWRDFIEHNGKGMYRLRGIRQQTL